MSEAQRGNRFYSKVFCIEEGGIEEGGIEEGGIEELHADYLWRYCCDLYDRVSCCHGVHAPKRV